MAYTTTVHARSLFTFSLLCHQTLIPIRTSAVLLRLSIQFSPPNETRLGPTRWKFRNTARLFSLRAEFDVRPCTTTRSRSDDGPQARQNRDSLLLIFTLGRIDSFEHWSACAMEKWIPYEANHSRTCTSEKQKAGRYWRKTFLFLLFRCVMNNARDAQIARNASCASLTATAESKRIESVTVSRAEQPRERETGMDRERERERGERSAYNRLR